ncbi:MAG: GNAT family N-acetyltransferase [Candidatus Woesearchaeota archaeon]
MLLNSKNKTLLLRNLKISDLKLYFEIMQDKETKKGFMTTPNTIQEAKKELQELISETKKKNPKNISLAIIYENNFAGYVGCYVRNKKPFTEKGVEAAIVYSIHPNFRGKNIATNAVKLLVNYIFKTYKIKRISGRCRTFNKASARVLEKAGFKLEGIHRKEAYKDGKYLDNMIWAIVK